MTATAPTTRPEGLLRNTVIMGLGSLASRGLGVIRMIVLGIVVAAGSRPGEIVAMATQIPTIIYFLIAGSVLNNVFMPQIVRAMKNDDDGGEAYINRMVTLFLIVLGLATLLCTVFAPQVLQLQMASAWRAPEMASWYRVLLLMVYLSMVQIFCYGAYYIFGQVLNAKGIFGPMMWAPVINNLVSIAVFLGYLAIWGSQPATAPFSTSQAVFLSVGMTAAVALQAVIMVPYLRRAEIKLRPRFDWKGTGLGSTLEAFKWVLLVALISQIVTFMQTKLASIAVGKDALAAGQAVYNYAYTIWMVPHGLITVSLATALMPDLTRMALAGDMKAVARETTSTLRLTLTCMIPITAALAFLSMPLCRLLFGWGANQTSWRFIAWTLMAFALAYPIYTFFYIINRAFYAMEDTKTAFKVAVVTDVALLLGAVCGVVFIGKSGWVAPTLALALLAGTIPGSVYGWRMLNRRLHTSLAEVFRLSVRLSLASLPAGLAAHYSCSVLESAMSGPVGTLLGLSVAGCAGLGVFFAISRVLHIEDVAELVDMVKSRLNRNRNSVVQSGENPAVVDVEPEILVEEPALADLVEPMALGEVSPEDLEDNAPVSRVIPGDVLGQRYRLDLLMARRNGTLTWRAFDTTLQRDVLIHILAPGAERSFEILAAARQASVATDSRFLRVLDAVHSDSPTLGSYVICEFTQGLTLEQVLRDGPLTAVEVGWLGRELAEALIGVHASGLYHERLSPDTILLSSNGNVKIVGFLMEKAIRPVPSDDTLSEVEREARDLDAVGKLLYASLITAWPGGPGYGMPAAPTDAHGYLTPRQVKAGISPALDLVVDQLLSRPPRSKQAPLRTANELFAALTKVVGTADAAPDVERRIRRGTRGTDAAISAPAVSSSAAAMGTVSAHGCDDTQTTVVIPVPEVAETVVDRPAPFTPVPPPASREVTTSRPDQRSAAPRRRLGPLVLIAVVSVALAAGLTLTLVKLAGISRQGTTVTAAPSIVKHKRVIAGAKDFDPLGSKNEIPQEVPNAIDGDPATIWHTETYNPAVWNKKHAVGLYVDLGAVDKVNEVQLTLLSKPSSVQILVPKDSTATEAPTTLDGWTKVSEHAGIEEKATLTFEATPARYVLVWFTDLPVLSDGNLEGGIAEIVVQGP